MKSKSLHIIGLGPGSRMLRTLQAIEALEQASTIVGYTGYIELLTSEEQEGKNIYATPMRGEIERVEYAISLANMGERVAIVSSGDASIYAMAGLAFELLEKKDLLDISVTIIPGISALSSAGSLLGSPLTNDFAVISLSDLLTPSDIIEKRLLFAFEADFTVVLYNPRSKKRELLFEKALKIAKKFRNIDTPVGIVSHAYREKQEIIHCTLENVDVKRVTMFSTVIIGNSATRYIAQYMVAPRGYEQKYTY